MPTASLAVTCAAAALAIALLLLPGWAMLRIAGFRGLLGVALAPACSTAVLGTGAIVAPLLGSAWGFLPALGATAAGLVLALVVRRLWPQAPADPRPDRAALIGLAAGVLLAAVPVLFAGSADAYLQRWDSLFHLAALQQITETGNASTLALGSLSFGDGHAAIYPAGWHALASLLPGPPSGVLLVGSTVTSAVPWVLGSAVFAHQLIRPTLTQRGPLIATAAVLAGLISAAPMSLWMGWGHVPNAAGLAMLPAAVALGLAVVRNPQGRVPGAIALVVALAGIALAHPNAALAVIVLLLPVVAGAIVRGARTDLAAGRRIRAVVVPLAAVLTVLALAAAFLRSPLAASVVGFAGTAPQSLPLAILDVVTGTYLLWPSAAGAAIGVLAVVGAVVFASRGQRLGAVMLALAAVLYLDAATGGQWGLARLWYTSAARISVIMAAVAVPLAAAALVAAYTWLRARPRRVVLAAAAAVVALALVIPSVAVQHTRVTRVFNAEPGNPPQFVTDGELAMIGSLPGLTDATILGSPFSGASSAYGLVGVPVVFPVAGQVWSPDQQLIVDNLESIANGTANAQVCAAVERLDIGYLYQDSAPYQVDHRYELLDSVEVRGGQVIAQADTARVLQLPPCAG